MGAFFSFKIQAQPKGRPRFCRGFTVTDSKTRAYEKALSMLARAQYRGEPIEGALEVKIKIYLQKPKRTKNESPCVRPDLDNYIKAILDALNGIAFKDDGQIVDLSATKRYGEPRIEVSINEAGNRVGWYG